jgi:hypothetical protein
MAARLTYSGTPFYDQIMKEDLRQVSLLVVSAQDLPIIFNQGQKLLVLLVKELHLFMEEQYLWYLQLQI